MLDWMFCFRSRRDCVWSVCTWLSGEKSNAVICLSHDGIFCAQLRHHGCVQVHAGVMEEEAVGCDALSAACPLLAVSPTLRSAPRSQTDQTWQGTEIGLQGQARWASPGLNRVHTEWALGTFLCLWVKTSGFGTTCNSFYSLLGYVIYRVRVRRGGRKRPVPKGATYGKPVHHGVNQLKFARSLQSVAEVRSSWPAHFINPKPWRRSHLFSRWWFRNDKSKLYRWSKSPGRIIMQRKSDLKY